LNTVTPFQVWALSVPNNFILFFSTTLAVKKKKKKKLMEFWQFTETKKPWVSTSFFLNFPQHFNSLKFQHFGFLDFIFLILSFSYII
jgi:hypothetical protein